MVGTDKCKKSDVGSQVNLLVQQIINENSNSLRLQDIHKSKTNFKCKNSRNLFRNFVTTLITQTLRTSIYIKHYSMMLVVQ